MLQKRGSCTNWPKQLSVQLLPTNYCEINLNLNATAAHCLKKSLFYDFTSHFKVGNFLVRMASREEIKRRMPDVAALEQKLSFLSVIKQKHREDL